MRDYERAALVAARPAAGSAGACGLWPVCGVRGRLRATTAEREAGRTRSSYVEDTSFFSPFSIHQEVNCKLLI